MNYLDENFDAYPVGTPIPPFPHNLGGIWFNPGSNGGHIIADGAYHGLSLPTSSKCMFLGDMGGTCAPPPVVNGAVVASVIWSFLATDVFGGGGWSPTVILSLINTMYPIYPPPAGYQGAYIAELLYVSLEEDLTLSLYTDLGLLLDPTTGINCNSGITAYGQQGKSFSLRKKIWYMLRLDLSLYVPIGDINIHAGGILYVDGKKILEGKANLTGYTVLNPQYSPNGVWVVPPLGLFNGIITHGGGYFSGFVDNITVLDLTDDWPHKAKKPDPKGLVSQLAVEYATPNLHTNGPTMNVSQMVVEVAGIPTKTKITDLSAKVRNTALVVEVMGPKGSTIGGGGSGWLVKES